MGRAVNVFQLIAAARKGLAAVDAAGGVSDELGLVGRALGNALASTGFPVGKAFAVYTRLGISDPLALARALRDDQDVRVWVACWSGALGAVGPPGGVTAPAAKARPKKK